MPITPSEYTQTAIDAQAFIDFATRSPLEDSPPPVASSRPHHQSILGRRGILRPIHDRDRVAAHIADLKTHREFRGKEVPSWEETRAYWKPRLEAETWDDWLIQGGKKKGQFRPRPRQHAITLRRPLTRSQAERISNLAPGPLRWVEPGEEIVEPVLRYLEGHPVVPTAEDDEEILAGRPRGRSYDVRIFDDSTDLPTAEEGLRRSIQERWVEVDDPTLFTITAERRQVLDEFLEEANTRE